MRVAFFSRGGGKSQANAIKAAELLKAGHRVLLFDKDGQHEIVGVPGFDDGRQLTDQSQNSDSQGVRSPAAPTPIVSRETAEIRHVPLERVKGIEPSS